jgi:hypothetical protein
MTDGTSLLLLQQLTLLKWCRSCVVPQARLQEATRQLSGGGGDGLSFREVRQRLAESEGKLMKAARAEEEQAAKVCAPAPAVLRKGRVTCRQLYAAETWKAVKGGTRRGGGRKGTSAFTRSDLSVYL